MPKLKRQSEVKRHLGLYELNELPECKPRDFPTESRPLQLSTLDNFTEVLGSVSQNYQLIKYTYKFLKYGHIVPEHLRLTERVVYGKGNENLMHLGHGLLGLWMHPA